MGCTVSRKKHSFLSRVACSLSTSLGWGQGGGSPSPCDSQVGHRTTLFFLLSVSHTSLVINFDERPWIPWLLVNNSHAYYVFFFFQWEPWNTAASSQPSWPLPYDILSIPNLKTQHLKYSKVSNFLSTDVMLQMKIFTPDLM